MIIDGVSHRILRITLPMAVIVNYQIAGESHQPIRKVALFCIVLVERTVDAYENLLREIFGSVGARGETVCEIEDPPRIRGDYLLPSRSVARASTPDEFRTINFGRSL